jgi:hypothetical protein
MADPKKTPEKSENPAKAAPLAAVAKRYEQALPHVAAEMSAYGLPAAAPDVVADPTPIALYKLALMAAMVQLEAVAAAKMMGASTVAAKQHTLVGMLAEVTAAPAKK